ncbi:MAG TPA: hypothetical protein VG389_19585 [Myxococcota bacterium]|jgi:hypothetical protein|nr:hypothetical protein [Myxococcota bacterium]
MTKNDTKRSRARARVAAACLFTLGAGAGTAAAFGAPGCGPRCGLDEGSLATLDYSGDHCEQTGVLVDLSLGGEAFDYVELSVGPLEDGRVEVTQLYPGADGTIMTVLEDRLGGWDVGFGARGYRATGAVAFGSTSVIVEPGFVATASLALVACAAPNGPLCTGGQLTYCDGGVTRTVTCAEACDAAGVLCSVPAASPPACGPACGLCPSNCICDQGTYYCQ